MGEIHDLGVPTWHPRPQVGRIKLQLVSDTGRWPVLTKEPEGDLSPFMSGKGDGGVELLCGNCEHLLAEHIYPADKMAGIVLCCPACGGGNLA